MYTEVDLATGQFLNPDLYGERELELRDIMLELEDGSRLKHFYLGTESDAQRAARELMLEAVEKELVQPELLDELLKRIGDDKTRPDGFRISNPRLGVGEESTPLI